MSVGDAGNDMSMKSVPGHSKRRHGGSRKRLPLEYITNDSKRVQTFSNRLNMVE